jgi:hypothetical protein
MGVLEFPGDSFSHFAVHARADVGPASPDLVGGDHEIK